MTINLQNYKVHNFCQMANNKMGLINTGSVSINGKIKMVIITDLGSVDPDDAICLIMALFCSNVDIVGIIVTHHYANKRALLAKLLLDAFGKPDIPVFIGSGIKYSEEYNEDDRNAFLNDNPLFPSFFGYPKSVRREDLKESVWFPAFMQAYYEHYGKEHIESFASKIEIIPGVQFLVDTLKKYSSGNPLTVLNIAPMHDFMHIPDELYSNMKVFAMGGGIEKNIEEFIKGETNRLNVVPAGYNWGITPTITNVVLEKFTRSGTAMNLISSGFVRREDVSVSPEQYKMWDYLVNFCKERVPKITLAFMADWLYSMRGNKLAQHKNLCDLLAFVFASNPNLMNNAGAMVQVQMLVQNQGEYENYLKPKPGVSDIDKPLIEILRPVGVPGNVNLLYKLDPLIKTSIVKQLDSILFPHNEQMIINAIRNIPSCVSTDVIKVGCDTYYPIILENIESGFVNFTDLKKLILEKMALPGNSKIIQVVGDCSPFAPEETRFIESFIRERLTGHATAKHVTHDTRSVQPKPFRRPKAYGRRFSWAPSEPHVVEYGFTGYDNGDSKCTNQIVSDIIDKTQIPSLANLVAFHSVIALNRGCKFSRVNTHKTLVYSIDKGKSVGDYVSTPDRLVQFGDDISVTDSICDGLIVIEGGSQSFAQVINCLADNKPIHGLQRVRNLTKQEDWNEKTNSFIQYFSAVEFLTHIQDKIYKFPNVAEITVEHIKSFVDEYFAEGRRHLFDPRRFDASTKNELFDKGMNKFIEKELWKNLDSCCNFMTFVHSKI